MMVLPVALGLTLACPPHSAIPLVPQACPTRCKCNITTVNCSGLGLREIPEGIPPNTSSLDLSHNRISLLNLHRLKSLSDLRELNLRENRLTLLPAAMWSELPPLRVLDLSSNVIACSCPLDWLEKQFRSLDLNVRLVNQNTTDCDRYLKADAVRNTSLESCMIKGRRKRTPSCEDYCRNGGTCRPGREPPCQCVPPFSGRHCEVRSDDDKLSTQGEILISVDRVTTTSIAISWSSWSGRSQGRYVVEVYLESPSVQSFDREPTEVSLQSYVVERLLPGTSYRICVSALTEYKHQATCIVQVTQGIETTVMSATGPWKDDITFGSQSHDKTNSRNQFPWGGQNKEKPKAEGDEMHYAFISLASLFGVCLLLTIVIGLVYYKRVHSNLTEGDEAAPEVQHDGAETTADATGPPMEDIVLVLTGNEVHNGGVQNPAFDMFAECNGEAVAAATVEEEEMEKEMEEAADQNSKRLVRFTLPNNSQSCNHSSIQAAETQVSSNHQNVHDASNCKQSDGHFVVI